MTVSTLFLQQIRVDGLTQLQNSYALFVQRERASQCDGKSTYVSLAKLSEDFWPSLF